MGNFNNEAEETSRHGGSIVSPSDMYATGTMGMYKNGGWNEAAEARNFDDSMSQERSMVLVDDNPRAL